MSENTRAVVLGGSVAGLLAARVLADHYAEVHVVDRDDLSAAHDDDPRRGVPQGAHVHGLLVSGLAVVESLLPGYTATLAARGANVGDVSRAAWWFAPGPLARTYSGLRSVSASRPLLEGELRRRVLMLPNVRLRGRTDIAGIIATPDGARITGVRLVDRAPGSAASVMNADLVVDATGRGSRTPAWLEDLGYQAPPEDVADLGITYVSRHFAVRDGDPDFNACVVTLRPPDTHTGVLLRQEGGRWLLTLAARGGRPAPLHLDDFREFAGKLPAAEIAKIAASDPLGEPATFKYPTTRWRHYERCEKLPKGLVVIGDAVCSFDPTFGQGMSSAALQADVLRRELATGTDDLERRVANGAADVARQPWTLAAGTHRRLPGNPPKPLPERLVDRYIARLQTRATTDDELAIAFLKVVNLLAPPQSLLTPRMMSRVLRRTTSPATPAALPDPTRADLPSRGDPLVG